MSDAILSCCLQDHKLKHMADLQQSVVSDTETKRQITGQIVQWEENLERLHCEQFRLRCYMASLQSGELPNPKVSLSTPSLSCDNTTYRHNAGSPWGTVSMVVI